MWMKSFTLDFVTIIIIAFFFNSRLWATLLALIDKIVWLLEKVIASFILQENIARKNYIC